MVKKVGYARVSTSSQELNLQIDALKEAGIISKLIFTDKISGAKENRPGLDKCLASLEKGDTLIVYSLSRLGRSLPHLIKLIESLYARGVKFKSISDGAIDTTTASGELIFNIFSSLAQFERKLIQERTRAGLKAARARGRLGGRPKKLPSDPKVKTAQKMHKDNDMPINEICSSLDISRATFYRYLSVA